MAHRRPRHSAIDPFSTLDGQVRHQRPFEVMAYRAIRVLEDEEAAELQIEVIGDEKHEESENRRTGWLALEKRDRLLERFATTARDKSKTPQERRAAGVGIVAMLCDLQNSGSHELILQLTRDSSPKPPYPSYEDLREIRPAFKEISTFIRAGAFKPADDPNPILVALVKILHDAGGNERPFEFRRKGKQWQLTFEEEEGVVGHTKGMMDLRTMLSQPTRGLSVLELVEMSNPTVNPRLLARAKAGTRISPAELVDKVALEQFKSTLSELMDARDRAKRNGDDAELSSIEKELSKLEPLVRSSMKKGGSSRLITTPAEKARKAVSKRIGEAIKEIQKSGMHKLAEHLKASISLGVTCKYTPASPIQWTLD